MTPPLPRAVAWLLYLLPAAFREDYGRDWLRTWQDEWRDGSPTRRRSLWLRALGDTVRVVPIRRACSAPRETVTNDVTKIHPEHPDL